jgi:hypothetical protein
VDKLNLREKPSLDAKTLKVLKRGDKLKYLKGEGKCYENNQGYQWIKVELSDKTVGWTAQIFTIREQLYLEYRDVIMLVKQRDIKKAKEIAKDKNDRNLIYFDDEKKYLFIHAYNDIYPDLTNYPSRGETIYLKSGEGLFGAEFSYHSGPAIFSDTGDYFTVLVHRPVPPHSLYAFNLSNMQSNYVGSVYSYDFVPESDLVIYLSGDNLDMDRILPGIYVYNPDNDETVKVLVPDLTTLEGNFPDETIIMKLIPPSEIPDWIDMDKVKQSEIYKKYESGVRCEVFYSEA